MPQSNQRGIETAVGAEGGVGRAAGLNRTSVGLKQRRLSRNSPLLSRLNRTSVGLKLVGYADWWRKGPWPQSNQRGIET